MVTERKKSMQNHFTKQGGLSKFTVKTLKAICEHFQLSFKSKDAKAVLITKLTDMVNDCSCWHSTKWPERDK